MPYTYNLPPFQYPSEVTSVSERGTIDLSNNIIINASNANDLVLNTISFSDFQAKTDLNTTNYSNYTTNLQKYKTILLGNNEHIEQMTTNTVDEFLGDSNLIIIQQKYINIIWSILAIGTFIFTITNLKK